MVRTWLESWPVVRQLTDGDRTARGAAAKSRTSASLAPRIATADKVVKSICPFCAVGCGQNVYVKGERVVGRLCPRGSSTYQLVTSPRRESTVRYRRPHGTEWEDLDLDTAMDMIADRVLKSRDKGWEEEHEGHKTRRTMGFASLGGATLDNEENYLIKKLFTALGAIQIENQARI
jgi:formate dehydrogenase major subunit